MNLRHALLATSTVLGLAVVAAPAHAQQRQQVGSPAVAILNAVPADQQPDVVLDIPVTARRSTLGLLSPDGKALMVGPYLVYTEDNQIRDTRGMRVVDVASGRSTTLPASPVGGYGWTPDGHVFSVDGQQAVVCDPADGECTTTELSLGVSPGDLRTLRLGGLVTDS